MTRLALLPLLAVMACTEFPQLDARIDAAALDAPSPALIPLDQLLAQVPQSAPVAGPSPDRLAALRARAARLRGAVIDPATRARMTRGVSNPF